jgi:hypothetical protein
MEHTIYTNFLMLGLIMVWVMYLYYHNQNQDEQ